MIVPTFSATATERVLPRLALDFTTAVLDPRVTVTRTTGASNPATYVDSNGYIVNATNNQPRFDFDPVTKICRGLLIEEPRANIVLRSEEFTNGYWNPSNVTVDATSVLSPRNTLSAQHVYPTTTGSSRSLGISFSATGGQAYTYSLYAKASGLNWIYFAVGGLLTQSVFFNVSTGQVGTIGNVLPFIADIKPAANGFWRCTITYTRGTTGTGNFIFGMSDGDATLTATTNGTNGIDYFGAQLEAGAFATSYIPTTTTSLTRNADVVSMTGTNFSSWYNATEGTFAARGTRFATGLVTNILGVSDGTTTNRIRLYQETNSRMTINTSVLGSTTTGNGSATYGVAAAYSSGGVGVACNGGTVAVSAAGAVPTGISSMDIGRNSPASTVTLNGWLQSILYWPQRLTNAELQAFSK